MTLSVSCRTAIAVAIGLACSDTARADTADYAFQLLQPEIKLSEPADIAVRLIDNRSGKTVADAVILASRLDMAPDGMATMQAPLEARASSEPGTYRFMAKLTMEGGWRLSLAAKIQGEAGTLENRLTFRAVP